MTYNLKPNNLIPKTYILFLISGLFAFFILLMPNTASAAACPDVPMGGITDYVISSDCTFAETVDGVDGVGITINVNQTLTINSGQVIAWGPDKSVVINGSLAMSGGRLRQTYLYMIDGDDDGYPPDAAQYYDQTIPAGSKRRKDFTNFTYVSNITKFDNDDTKSAVYPEKPCDYDENGSIDICTENKDNGTCGYADNGTDPGNDCGALDCDGGGTRYYNGWSSEICYYKDDVTAGDADCNSSGSCKSLATECGEEGKGASTGVDCGQVCESEVSCSGTTAGSCGNPGDDANCGTIDCDGMNYYWTSGSPSVAGTNYCKLRDYADITSNRCEGVNDCKDANSADCTSYGDSTVATCGACRYATGACSSCTNYSGNSCGSSRYCQGGSCKYCYWDYTGTGSAWTTESCGNYCYGHAGGICDLGNVGRSGAGSNTWSASDVIGTCGLVYQLCGPSGSHRNYTCRCD